MERFSGAARLVVVGGGLIVAFVGGMAGQAFAEAQCTDIPDDHKPSPAIPMA